MKTMMIMMLCLFLSACGLKLTAKPSENQKKEIQSVHVEGEVPYYLNSDGTHRWTYPPAESLTAEQKRFYVEGNPCITPTYILARFAMNGGNFILVSIGSNCLRTDEIVDGISAIEVSEDSKIKIIGLDQYHVPDILQIDYEFPDGFVPTDYLDYLDYATKIQKYTG